MAEKDNVQQLYSDFCRFLRDVGTNSFFSFFQKAVRSSQSNLSVFEKYVERRVDFAWVEAMEAAIIPLDSIIRKPNSFIKLEEDIIPIAQARGIGPESVRHLSQHTSLISSVKKGFVTPSRILNVTKEDSLDTYENRFIYTLIRQTAYFLDKRMQVLMKDTKQADQFEYHVDGSCNVGNDKVSYNFKMHLEAPHEEVADDQLINADVSQMTPMQRIERLRKIFYTFQGSLFFRSLYGVADVRPPLVMTNVLRKNPNFVSAVSLWNFINSYDKLGYTTEDVEQFRTPTEQDKNELYALVVLQYALMKKREKAAEASLDEAETAPEAEVAAPTVPNIVRHSISELCDTFDLSVDEVRKVYEKELRKKEKKRDANYSKVRGVFERAFESEKENDRKADIVARERLLAQMLHTLQLAEEDEKARQAAAALPATDVQTEIGADGFIYRFRYSFKARLIQGGEPLQTYYGELKNHILSYEKVNARMAWGYERFYSGRAPICKISGRGKKLSLYLTESCEKFADTKYRVEDLREEGKETPYPTRFPIRSMRALKYAEELIDMRMRELGLAKGETPQVDYRLPFETVEEMLQDTPPLVKRVKGGLATLQDREKAQLPVAAPAPAQVADEGELPEDGDMEYSYRYSFTARLIQGGEPIQSYYTEIKNYLMSYEKVASHMSWEYERFHLKREPIVKINGRGLTLNVLFALNPELIDENKYHIEDMRAESKDAEHPFRMRIRSDRAVKCAEELIDMRMAQLGVKQGEIPSADYHLPSQTREEMLNADPPLIKKEKNGLGNVISAAKKKAGGKAAEEKPAAKAPVAATNENPAKATVAAVNEKPAKATVAAAKPAKEKSLPQATVAAVNENPAKATVAAAEAETKAVPREFTSAAEAINAIAEYLFGGDETDGN